MTRQRLPNRRPLETRELCVNVPPGRGREIKVSVGWDSNSRRPLEVFLTGAKDGSELGAILDDIGVVISVALQHGVSARDLAKSVARVPVAALVPTDLARSEGPAHIEPASIIGATLDLLCEMEAA